MILNTSGGVTGGDRFAISARTGAGSAITLTTQAAERLYRAEPGETARIDVDLHVAEGASLHWLPQETILYNHANAARTLTAHVGHGGRLLAVEPLIFGRRAMGERLSDTRLCDSWKIYRQGELVFADNLRLSGPVEARLDQSAIAAGCHAMASLVMLVEGADRLLPDLRRHLGETGGATVIGKNVLFARVLATDGFELRRRLVPALEFLAAAPLPRTWMI